MISKALLSLSFGKQKVVVVDPIPPHLEEAALPWIRQLEASGFHRIGGWCVEWGTESAFDELAVILAHGTDPIRAVIRPYGEAARSGECWVELHSTQGETEIITASYAPEQLSPLPAGLEPVVVITSEAGPLLERHRERIAGGETGEWSWLDLAGAVRREQALCDLRFADMAASGKMAVREGGNLGFRVWPALQRAVMLLKRAAALKKASKGLRVPPTTPVTLSVESLTTFDWRHYRQIVALTRGRFSSRIKAVLTVVSFLAFAGVLAWQLSPTIAVTMLVALVFHECGHLAGMWWFGYRDTQLLFIPFFGGAAVGHDDKVLKPWQHIVIILLGPLPGLFIGFALLAYHAGGGGPHWLHQATLTVIGLNLFNLLPILPLDGGQIVDFAVASRFPRARVFFLACSALGLLALGLALDGVKVLVFLAVIMLLRLPAEWRLANVRRTVRAEFPHGGEEEPVVRRVLQQLRMPAWSKTPMSQRLQSARGLQQALRMPRPGLGTMCFAIVGYTAPFWLGAPLAVWGALRKAEAQVRQAEATAVAAGLTLPVEARPVPAPADNAGSFYAQAEALAPSGLKRKAAAEHETEIIALLRQAAHKPVFVPVKNAEVKKELGWSASWTHGFLTQHLIYAADERLRYHEPMEAAALLIDALRLARLMDAAPGWWNWNSHCSVVVAAWNGLEKVLASGVKLPPEMVAELRDLSAEETEIAFAESAIPRSLMEQVHYMDEFKGRSEVSGIWRVLALMQKYNPSTLRGKRDTINEAVRAHGYLVSIQRGQWPESVVDIKSEGFASMAIGQLGDVLARQRQARVALAMIERRQRGETAEALDQLGFSASDLQHPLTRESMNLTRRGAFDVLALASGVPSFGIESDAEDGLKWRVPVEP